MTGHEDATQMNEDTSTVWTTKVKHDQAQAPVWKWFEKATDHLLRNAPRRGYEEIDGSTLSDAANNRLPLQGHGSGTGKTKVGDPGDGYPEGSMTIQASDSAAEHLLAESQSQSGNTEAKCSLFYVYLASAIAAFGGIIFGYDTGIISGALLQLASRFGLEDSCIKEEMAVCSMLFGALMASIVGGFLVDYFGRRLAIIGNAVIFIFGAVILAFTPSYSGLIVGRLVVGFAVSLSAIAECVYISEIAPAKHRGQLVSLNELGITFGFLLAYCVDYIFISMKDGWRYMFGLSAIPAVIQGFAMLFLPQSPRFLIIQGQEEKARKTLHKLRGPVSVEGELEDIKNSLQNEKSCRFVDLCSNRGNMRFRLIIGMGVVFFQQFTGQPSVLYYAPIIFKSVGFQGDRPATLATVGLGIVKVLFTGITLLFVDKGGRRKFLLTGATIMTLSIATLGLAMATWPNDLQESPCGTNQYNRPWNSTNSNNDTVIEGNKFMHRLIPGVTALSQDFKSKVNIDSSITTTVRTDVSHSAVSAYININETMERSSEVVPPGARWVALIALMSYIAGYAIGFGPVSWLVLSEIFPSHLRGRAVSMATIFNWGANLVVSLTFLDLMRVIGVSWTFLLYSAICLLSAIFVFCLVPETKGYSLEQISTDLYSRSSLCTPFSNCRHSSESTHNLDSVQGVIPVSNVFQPQHMEGMDQMSMLQMEQAQSSTPDCSSTRSQSW